MTSDKHKTPKKESSEHNGHDEKEMKKKKPFGEGTNTDKGKNLDSYDKEQKNDKELVEKKK